MKEKIGFIFDILTIDNGIILTFFRIFKVAFIKDNQGYGTFYTLMLAIHKLETSVSIAWRTKNYGDEESEEIQNSQKRKKSQTTIASA